MSDPSFSTPAEEAVDRASWASIAVVLALLLLGGLRLAGASSTRQARNDLVSVGAHGRTR